MLFRMRFNTPFRMFRLLTVQGGFVLVDMRFNFEKCYNHNHRPCRWFAQAPLGPITSRAYRLIEFSFCCMMRPTAIEIAVCRILLFVTLDYLPF